MAMGLKGSELVLDGCGAGGCWLRFGFVKLLMELQVGFDELSCLVKVELSGEMQVFF
jgi:hypothetical protein